MQTIKGRLWGRTLALTLPLAALSCASPGLAADLMPAVEPLPVAVPGTQWGGLYIGGQLGGAWNQSDWRFQNFNYWNTLGPNLVGTKFDQSSSGVMGGGQVGFNYQAGAWVFGIEGSAAATDLNDTIRSPLFPTDFYSTKIEWLATATGRVGYAQGAWLAYAKAGWAGANVELNLSERNTGIRAGDTSWANGWTVGGGLEYALGPRFSLGVEYDYADLDTGNWTLPCARCGSGVGGGRPIMDGDLVVQSVAARLNYRFGR
jgi:outer membrane immunogenic protein